MRRILYALAFLGTSTFVQSQFNVLLKTHAIQSSTGWGGDAQRAVDGSSSTNYEDLSCTHTTE